ncbi:hypothetical protein BRM42_22080 [Xanthomonas oryzae pv. oryzae]|nr:hypothetical protein BRM42_22080 [Xanthomonas oryzae pv. oryzae]
MNLQEMSMTIVYGGCIEPGGMKLDNEVYSTECPQCGQEASQHSWQRCEGSINHYWSVQCNYCGYRDGNDDDEYPDPGFYNPEDDYPAFGHDDGFEESAVG